MRYLVERIVNFNLFCMTSNILLEGNPDSVTMENKTNSTISNSDFLSDTYRGGVERILGLNGRKKYVISSEIIKQRQQDWDKLFQKYSEDLSDQTELNIETFKPCNCEYKAKRVFKTHNAIQYWINTGYLPHQEITYKNNYLERKPNINYIKPYCNKCSFSSSVDTAEYILSNINTTNKVETMAIIEGAKYDNVENFRSTAHYENTEIFQGANDTMCHINTGCNIRNSYTNKCNYEKCKLTQLEKLNTKTYNKYTNIFKQLKSLNVIVPTSNLSKIRKSKHERRRNKMVKTLENLNPVVTLTRLSSFDIQKYKQKTNMMKNAEQLNGSVSTQKLSKTTPVQEHESTFHKKIPGKDHLLPDTVHLIQNRINSIRLSLNNISNCSQPSLSIINVTNGDIRNNQTINSVYRTSETIDSTSTSTKSTLSRSAYQTNRNLSFRKRRKENSDSILNISNLQTHTYSKLSVDETEVTLKDSYNDNVGTDTFKKIESHNVSWLCDEKNELIDVKHCSKNKQKSNDTKQQNNNRYNNLIEAKVHGVTGGDEFGKEIVNKSSIKVLSNVKIDHDKTKYNTNYLYFETKLYDSSNSSNSDNTDVTSDD